MLCIRMAMFKKYVSSRSYHPLRTYRCIPYLTRFCSDQKKSHKNSTFLMRKVGYIVNMAAIIVVLLGDSVL